jgi:tRNA pseudouridine38-40 synthase
MYESGVWLYERFGSGWLFVYFCALLLSFMRYFLDLAYKGTAYHGWQSQDNATSVQACVAKALSVVLRTDTPVMGSGRTDTGVHAEQQIAHFDSVEVLDSYTFIAKINALLPYDIAIKALHQVADTAHARFDATERSYQYRITTYKSPFLRELAYHYRPTINLEKMNESASKLLLYQDFQAFSKTGSSNKHFLCHLKRAEWLPTPEGYTFHITANRFLYGMVRALVGTLLEVGVGKLSVADFEEILQSKNRQNAKRSAPPEGLFLTRIVYPYLG